MRFLSRLLLPLSCCVALMSPARAQDKLFIAGAETGSQYSNYGLLGVVVPLPGSSLGNGYVARLFADGLTYRYETNNNDIDATAFAVDTSLGYMGSDAKGWWGVYAGPVWRHTDLSPDDRQSQARGGQTSLRMSAEGDRAIAEKYRANAIVSYSAFADNAFWNRLRIMRNIGGDLYLGPEGVWQGSDEYRAWQAGIALTGIKVSDTGSLGLKAGVRKGGDVSYAPYAGVEFGMTF